MAGEVNTNNPSPLAMANGLPPDLQTLIANALQQQQMAHAFQAQAMQPIQPQQIGPVAAKVSPLAFIAQALQGVMAAKMGSDASKQIAGIQGQYQNQTSDEIQKLEGMPEADRVAAAQASRNPIVQSLGKTWYDAYQKRVGDYVQATKDTGPQMAADAARTGNMPSTPLPSPQAPQVQMVPMNGQQVPMVVNTGKGGFQTGTISAPGAVINMPGQERALMVGHQLDDLKSRQGDAKTAMQVLEQNRQAVEALGSGAQAGGGGEFKQKVRKVLQGFGVQMPDTATTDQLQQALGNSVISNAKDLKPLSDSDRLALQQTYGSIGTDPTALSNLLATTSSAALKQLHDYHTFVGEAQKTALTPDVKDMYNGATVGFDMPKQLFGPTHFQLQMAKDYVNRGGDPSVFNDPVTGKPMDADTQFNIHPQAIGAVPPAGAAAPPATTYWKIGPDGKLVPTQGQ